MNLKKADWNAIIIALYTQMEKNLKESKEAWLINDFVDTSYRASDVSDYLKLTMKVINSVERMKDVKK